MRWLFLASPPWFLQASSPEEGFPHPFRFFQASPPWFLQASPPWFLQASPPEDSYKPRFLLKLFLVIALFLQVLPIPSQSDSIPAPIPPGQMIDIGGWRLHLYGQGLHNTSGPTVICENGIRGFSFDWHLVQSKVASFAKIYTYDRAGSAWSDLGPRPHTMQQSVYDLHKLLQTANLAPPFILVGASHGGLLVRLYAQQYPDEVAGLILVDSGFENAIQFINGKQLRPAIDATGQEIPAAKTMATAEDNNLARTPEAIKIMTGVLKQIGLSKTVEPPFNNLPDSIQKMRLWALSRFEYYVANDNKFLMDEKARMIKDRETNPFMFLDKPLIVLTATISDDPYETERRANQAAMINLSRNSKQILATRSGHHIHLDEPELVTEAIREVMEAVINKSYLRK